MPSLKNIFILTMLFSLLISFGSGIINAQTLPSEGNVNYNKSHYQSINIPVLSNVGVAIATNIGTNFVNSSKSSVGNTLNGSRASFSEILDINEMLNNPEKAHSSMIQTNMLNIREYLAYLRNDLKSDLEGASNKSQFLSEYTKQLELRYKSAAYNLENLGAQKSYLEGIMRESDERIESIKIKLDRDFKDFNGPAVMIDTENYLEQSKKKRLAYTYLVFTNKFIEQYSFLNNYNKELIDVLILNKKAISTESYVVIPDSGINVLKDFDLLYDEGVFKSQQ